MAYEIFKGLMQMDSARAQKALAKKEATVKERYMGALTAGQELQTTLLKAKLDAGMIELEREAKAQANIMGKSQHEALKMRNRKMREMLDSKDPDEVALATSALLGIDANRQSDSMIDALSLQNQQMKTHIDMLTFNLREQQSRRDSAGDILNLATSLASSGMAKEIFGEEGEPFMKEAVRNAFVTYMGGELPPPSSVPQVAPDKPSWLDSIFNKGKYNAPGTTEGQAIDSEVLEKKLGQMREGVDVK